MNDININTKTRHELKYYINYFDYVTLRHRLKLVMQQDPHSLDDKGYYIRSLYFDDLDNSFMFEKQAGLIKRKKIRIRIYNNSAVTIKLEKKSKLDQLIKKEAVQISRQEYKKIMYNDIEFLREAGTQTSQMFYAEFKNCLLKPKVIVDYKREAYILHYAGVRITFDKLLCAGISTTDLFDAEQVLLRAIEPATMIMEIKYDSFLPDYIRSLIQTVSSRKVAISKYVLCRELKPSLF